MIKSGTFFVLSSLFVISLTAQAADTGLGASSLKLKVYKFAVSSSPLCTNLQTVVDNGSSPVEVEFVGGVNLGSGPIVNGTYPCVVIEFEDVIKFKPDANSTSGNCATATESSLDVCRSSTSALISGATTTCTVGADRVAMYLSTASASISSSDAFNAPTSIGDAAHGFTLSAALAVSGTASGKLIVNPAGKVCDDNLSGCDGGAGGTGTGGAGACKLEPPTFGFTQL